MSRACGGLRQGRSGFARAGDWRTGALRAFEDFARDRFIIGDKGSVKEEIARYRELLGVDHFIMRCQWPGLPQEQVLGSIQRLGEIFVRSDSAARRDHCPIKPIRPSLLFTPPGRHGAAALSSNSMPLAP